MPNNQSPRLVGTLPPFWAKLAGERTPPTYHPLVCHLLDVAAVAEAMWDRVLPEVVRRDIADGLRVTLAGARAWAVFLAAVHDLGKLSPAFQLRAAAGPLRPACEQWGGVLPVNIRPPHGLVSALALAEIFSSTPYAMPLPLAREFAAVAGGHHGAFPSPLTLQAVDSRGAGREPWRSARAVTADRIAALLGLLPEAPGCLSAPAGMLLAGLISVADWIASDERWFPHAAKLEPTGRDVDAVEYLEIARYQARAALDRLGWFHWGAHDRRLTFADLFPHLREPRPLQQVAVRVAEAVGEGAAGLVIIEAPMGEGKTEAALYLAHCWAQATGRRGFYIALPTQATSNQMFSRALSFLHAYPHAEHAQMQLLHGHACLSAEFELLRRGIAETAEPSGVATDQEGAGSVLASAWFSHRKRGLLAPFGVGTVDQPLLAALQTRRVFVRLFGLARRVVIVDEVHAYDTYMSALLERLLEWLAALQAPVVMLSATLPSNRRSALCAAYARGLGTSTITGEYAAPYPRLTRLTRALDGVRASTVPLSASSRSCRQLKVSWIDGSLKGDAANEIVSELGERLENGGCAVVVCNTVSRAQAIYLALKSR